MQIKKTTMSKRILILGISLLLSLKMLAAPITENFNSFSSGGYGNYSYNGWYIFDGLAETNGSNSFGGSGRAVRLDDDNGSSLTSPSKAGGIGTISFYYRNWSSPAIDFYVYTSPDSSVWTVVDSVKGLTNTTYSNFSKLVNDASAKYIKIVSSGQKMLLLDEFSITDASAGCSGFLRDTIKTTICSFDSTEFRNKFYKVAGFYSDTVISTCDTIFVLDLTTTTEVVYNAFDTICSEEDSLLFNGVYLKTAGTYFDTITRAGNCDSIVQLMLSTKYCPKPCNDLIISEYIEGSSNNKGIEIYNPTASSISLSNYRLVRYTNGNASSPNNISLGSTSIAPYGVFVIRNSSATLPNLVAKANMTSGSISFNGNDPVALQKNMVTIDIVGPLGSSSNFAANTTLVRKSTVQQGSIIYSASEWEVLGNDTDSLIGGHKNDCYTCITKRDTTTQSICQGDSATNGIKYYNTTGIFSDTVQTLANGCDSIRVLNLTVLSIERDTIQDTICQGTTVMLGSQTLSMTGTYSDTSQNLAGCDSISVLELFVRATFRDTIADTICQGASITFGTQTLTMTGTYSDTAQNAAGCDSITVMELVVNDYIRDTIADTICQGASITFGTQTLTMTGTYSDTAQNAAGCDSITVMELVVNDYIRDTIADTICQGASITFGTQTLTMTGTYSDTAQNAAGCDSITVMELVVNDYIRDTIADTICQGASITFGTQTLTMTGTYSDTAQNAAGCDSITVMELVVNDYIRDTIADTTCANSPYILGSQMLSTTGQYSDTTQNSAGCDSITTLNLFVKSINRDTVSSTICSGDSVQLGTKFYNATGIYSDTVQNAAGCDSISVLDLTVITYATTVLNIQACDSYTLVDGSTVNFTGIFFDTLTATSGCDSVIRTNLTVNYTQRTVDTIAACGSYTSPSGKVWTTSGTRLDTISTKVGCDSIISITLSISPNSSTTRNISSCFTYTVPETGNVYTTSGTYKDTATNAFGCSFFITTNLTINLANAGTVSVSGITLTANQTGVKYKWADCDNNFSHFITDTAKSFTPVRNGNYAVIVVTPEGCRDTSACTSIMSVDLEEYVIDEDNISVYPNPATDFVTVDVLSQNINEEVTIRLFDAIGKMIYSKQVSTENNKVVIDLDGLENGLYTVSVSNEFFNTTKKLTVVK